jgi:hypothetical protein
MFRMMLATQWKWTRTLVLIATIVGFAIPLAALRTAVDGWSPQDFVKRMQLWGAAYALLAAGCGLAIALATWAPDHRGRHVYALTLPVSRARYVLLRLLAGAVCLVPPVLAVLLGALAVSIFGAIPEGLHAYPLALTLRFAFAALVAYALFFAIGSATQKSAGVVLAIVAGVFLAQYVLALANVRYDLLMRAADLLFVSPGIFSVFAGRWTLIDA